MRKIKSPIVPLERTLFKELSEFFELQGYHTQTLYTPELDVMQGMKKKIPMDTIKRLIDKRAEDNGIETSVKDKPSIIVFYNRSPLEKSENAKVTPKAIGLEVMTEDEQTYDVFMRSFLPAKVTFELNLVLFDTDACDLMEYLILANLSKSQKMAIPYVLSFDGTDRKKQFEVDYKVKFSSINDVSFVEESTKGNLKVISITCDTDGAIISPYTSMKQGETNFNYTIEVCGVDYQTLEPFECVTLVDSETGVNILTDGKEPEA